MDNSKVPRVGAAFHYGRIFIGLGLLKGGPFRFKDAAAFLPARSAESWGMANVRLIRHEGIPSCGSFEVRFPDGRPSQFFYWEDLPSRRLRPDMVTSEVALEQAKALARGQWPASCGSVRRRGDPTARWQGRSLADF